MVLMKRRAIFLLWTCVFFLTSQLSFGQTFEESFRQGVQNYQEQKYQDASSHFSEALRQKPDDVNVMTNLALAQFQLGQKGHAVALLRKAVTLEPDFSTSRSALSFIVAQLDVKEIPHEIEFWETFRADWLLPFSLTHLLALIGITFFASGWLWIRFFSRRRTARIEQSPSPTVSVTAILASILLFVSIVLVALKIWDSRIPRGTVIVEKVVVYVAPDEKSAALFDLYGGLEVIVRNQRTGWIQITYPGGLTGWIPENSFMKTTGDH